MLKLYTDFITRIVNTTIAFINTKQYISSLKQLALCSSWNWIEANIRFHFSLRFSICSNNFVYQKFCINSSPPHFMNLKQILRFIFAWIGKSYWKRIFGTHGVREIIDHFERKRRLMNGCYVLIIWVRLFWAKSFHIFAQLQKRTRFDYGQFSARMQWIEHTQSIFS